MDPEKLILENGLTIKKGLDQHFLSDKFVDKEIALAGLKKGDVVLEIGAGIGNLTEKIATRCHVIAVEKDKQFIPLLRKIKNAEVINDDALSILSSLTFNKIISNIPYSISQPLLLALLTKKWDVAVLVVQKEFAEKMLSKSKLSVIVNDCCHFDVEEFITAGEFYPPAVDSAIVRMVQKRIMDEKFWRFLSVVYTQKNRNVKNVIKSFPDELAKKKVHQLEIKELKAIYEMNRK